MLKRLIATMAAVLLLGGVVAGCGDDEQGASEGDTAAQTATETVTEDEVVTETETETDVETVTEQTDTATADGGGAASPKAAKRGADLCMRTFNAPGLSADTKAQVKKVCQGAASGEDVQEAARELCRSIVEDTYEEGQAGRDEALESCERKE